MTEDPQPLEGFYLIRPRNAGEARCGKACLMTDTMIAQVLDAVKIAAKITASDGFDDVWRKFLDLWADDDVSVDEVLSV
jgi:hypothetical protein